LTLNVGHSLSLVTLTPNVEFTSGFWWSSCCLFL